MTQAYTTVVVLVTVTIEQKLTVVKHLVNHLVNLMKLYLLW